MATGNIAILPARIRHLRGLHEFLVLLGIHIEQDEGKSMKQCRQQSMDGRIKSRKTRPKDKKKGMKKKKNKRERVKESPRGNRVSFPLGHF